MTIAVQPHHGSDSRLNVGAVLLAAGSASRMGHRPKCLLELDGVPLIRRLDLQSSSQVRNPKSCLLKQHVQFALQQGADRKSHFLLANK